MNYDEKPDIKISRRSKLIIICVVVALLGSLPVLFLLASCWAGDCL